MANRSLNDSQYKSGNSSVYLELLPYSNSYHSASPKRSGAVSSSQPNNSKLQSDVYKVRKANPKALNSPRGEKLQDSSRSIENDHSKNSRSKSGDSSGTTGTLNSPTEKKLQDSSRSIDNDHSKNSRSKSGDSSGTTGTSVYLELLPCSNTYEHASPKQSGVSSQQPNYSALGSDGGNVHETKPKASNSPGGQNLHDAYQPISTNSADPEDNYHAYVIINNQEVHGNATNIYSIANPRQSPEKMQRCRKPMKQVDTGRRRQTSGTESSETGLGAHRRCVTTMASALVIIGVCLAGLIGFVVYKEVNGESVRAAAKTSAHTPWPTTEAGCVVNMISRGFDDFVIAGGVPSVISINGVATIVKNIRSFYVAAFNPLNCTVSNLGSFDTCTYSGDSQNNMIALVDYISGTPNGTLVVSIMWDDVTSSALQSAYSFILDMLGVDLSALEFRGKFAFMAQVGYPEKAILNLLRAGGRPVNLTVTV